MFFFPYPRSRLRINLVFRDGFASPVPRQPAHLHTGAGSGAYSRDSSQFLRRRPFISLNRLTPSSQSRVYRVTQLRTDGVHFRESAGTGPVNLKVVLVTGAVLAGHHGPINMRLSFPHPLLVLSGHVESTGLYCRTVAKLILLSGFASPLVDKRKLMIREGELPDIMILRYFMVLTPM